MFSGQVKNIACVHCWQCSHPEGKGPPDRQSQVPPSRAAARQHGQHFFRTEKIHHSHQDVSHGSGSDPSDSKGGGLRARVGLADTPIILETSCQQPFHPLQCTRHEWCLEWATACTPHATSSLDVLRHVDAPRCGSRSCATSASHSCAWGSTRTRCSPSPLSWKTCLITRWGPLQHAAPYSSSYQAILPLLWCGSVSMAAATCLNSVMCGVLPAPQTGYNLVVCAYALGDREAMKQAFLQLITTESQVRCTTA